MIEDKINTNYLLTCLSEECSEVTKAVCKSIRFGLDSDYMGETNADIILNEFYDLCAIMEMLQDQQILPRYSEDTQRLLKEKKKAKIYKNYKYKP